MISFESANFSYGSHSILGGTSCELAPGKLACVVGANGAGKSTLLRLAAGLLAPDAGRVTLDGSNYSNLPRHEIARRVSFLPQEINLAFPFKIREVVAMGRYPHQKKMALGLESESDLDIVDWAMQQSAVDHLADRVFSEISGGEKRRVMVAQALCQKAPYVLLDEPTAALDPNHAHHLFQILCTMRDQGAAIMVVTHDLHLALRYSDSLWVVSEGKVATYDGGVNPDVVAHLSRIFSLPIHTGTLDSGLGWVVPG